MRILPLMVQISLFLSLLWGCGQVRPTEEVQDRSQQADEQIAVGTTQGGMEVQDICQPPTKTLLELTQRLDQELNNDQGILLVIEQIRSTVSEARTSCAQHREYAAAAETALEAVDKLEAVVREEMECEKYRQEAIRLSQEFNDDMNSPLGRSPDTGLARIAEYLPMIREAIQTAKHHCRGQTEIIASLEEFSQGIDQMANDFGLE